MNTVGPYLKVVSDYWNEITHDSTFLTLTQVPGQWLRKKLLADRMAVNKEYMDNYRRFYETPTLRDTLEDNWHRFTIFAILERLTVVRQAQSCLKSRLELGGNDLSSLIQTIRDNGAIKGYFRGNLINLFHFIGVQYQSVAWSEGDFTKYLGFSLLFETLLYPVDTLRTLIYADVTGRFSGMADCLKQTLSHNSYGKLYSGLSFKLLYNVIFGMNLWAINNESYLKFATIPLWIASIGLLAAKVRMQVINTALSFQKEITAENIDHFFKRNFYLGKSGTIPFLVLNLLAMYNLPLFYGEEMKERILENIKKKAPRLQEQKIIA